MAPKGCGLCGAVVRSTVRHNSEKWSTLGSGDPRSSPKQHKTFATLGGMLVERRRATPHGIAEPVMVGRR